MWMTPSRARRLPGWPRRTRRLAHGRRANRGESHQERTMLRVHEIRKAYGGHQALDGVTFEIGSRDKVALVGVNGAGKSTLLKIIAGLLPADEGIVRTQDVNEIAYLPQDAGIRSGRTLWDEMMTSFPELIEIQAELAQVEASMATDYEDLDRLDQLVARQ